MQSDGCNCAGTLAVVGIGPGNPKDRTIRAQETIENADVIVSYTSYLKMISDLIENKHIISSGMGEEKKRCSMALEYASNGKHVVIISSGDSGIYGMAGLVLECSPYHRYTGPITIVPGVTAACASAAVLGAPLMTDFMVISLSDILVPLQQIENRLRAAALCGITTVLYNVKSRTRVKPFELLCTIFMQQRNKDTPVGIVYNASKQTQKYTITTLDMLRKTPLSMNSLVIIGAVDTHVLSGKMVTRRGYSVA